MAEHSTWLNYSKALNGYVQSRELYYPKPNTTKKQNESSKGFFGSLFSSNGTVAVELPRPKPPALPYIKKLPGLYIYGNPGKATRFLSRIGTGKTYMMDMFYSTIPFEQKLRIHFNEFMLQIHNKLHKLDHVLS